MNSTFDPLIMNLCSRSRAMYVFKLCTKFERNWTIRGRVIDNLTHFCRPIFNGAQVPEQFSGVRWLNFTKLVLDDIGPSSALIEFVSHFRYLNPFRNASGLKASGVKKRPKFRTFDPSKIRGTVSELSGWSNKAPPTIEPLEQIW